VDQDRLEIGFEKVPGHGRQAEGLPQPGRCRGWRPGRPPRPCGPRDAELRRRPLRRGSAIRPLQEPRTALRSAWSGGAAAGAAHPGARDSARPRCRIRPELGDAAAHFFGLTGLSGHDDHHAGAPAGDPASGCGRDLRQDDLLDRPTWRDRPTQVPCSAAPSDRQRHLSLPSTALRSTLSRNHPVVRNASGFRREEAPATLSVWGCRFGASWSRCGDDDLG
jgi:hypothetical protein